MFLFVVGLEIDIGYVKKNWKIASTVGLSSLIFPFCLGVALSRGLYDRYVSLEDRDNISFGVYSLFIGVAVAITAFPVLARILTELGLLRDRVGVVVLAAGISNDIIGWILLALTITLANSAKAINTLYIILLTIAWFILLVWGVKPLLTWYLRKTGSIENGPSEMAVSVCILLAFVSAFYTDIIGVHPIFGAFLAGAIIPRDNHFVVKLTEKIEDFITLILLPLYFSLAGLNVNIGALNDGISWAYVVAAIAVSMFGKIVGGMIPARLHGLRWREAFTVGGLMSCKGIVEIVVLQLGFQAGILSVKVFSMFIIMALITTFITTPLTLKLYPIWYRNKVAKWRNGEIEWDGTPIIRSQSRNGQNFKNFKLSKIVVIFDNVESMPITMVVTQLLAAPQKQLSTPSMSPHSSSPAFEPVDLSTVTTQNTMAAGFITQNAQAQGLHVSGLRLVDLTERTADIIQVMSGELIDGEQDPVIQVFSTFTKINHIPFEGKLAVTPQIDRSSIVMSVADNFTDFLVVGWADNRELSKSPELLKIVPQIKEGALQSHIKLGLARDLFEHAKSQVGFFLDRGFALAHRDNNQTRRVFLPFYGGTNDRLALGVATYLAKNTNFHITVAVFSEDENLPPHLEPEETANYDTRTLMPVEAWDYVTSLHDSLPSDIQNKFTLTRINPNHSITQSVLEVFDNTSLVSDLVVIGRCTEGTDNHNTIDHTTNPVTVTTASGSDAPVGMERTNSSLSVGKASLTTAHVLSSGESAFASNENSYTGELVGAATAELITSPQLNCSFFVCSAPTALINVEDGAEVPPKTG
ncbi:hypothetical protein D0Z00_004289 [Geotrichum galactomycetum]|uniref:Uncharacterized protein n=1 Tax=Geotrichum galactomycetum TaxID=27317 RepID=A0ACB6UYU6_9ASCO|nr:hypothetical protein D0Z00_004289 [Geotrichum candidum]